MDINKKINYSKINKLNQDYPKDLVLLSAWLVSQGFPYELQQKYRNSGWLKSIGKGAMLKTNGSLKLIGAIAALQSQANSNLHYGGRTALEIHGRSQYVRFNSSEATLYAEGQYKLPLWVKNNKWDIPYKIFRISLFRNETLGLTKYEDSSIVVNISTPVRAIMECLALCPNKFPLHEAYELMEGLNNLRPKKVQELLEECKSVKVKRLFLHFAERSEHNWFKYLDLTKINLGTGNRSLINNGILVPKYNLILPQNLI